MQRSLTTILQKKWINWNKFKVRIKDRLNGILADKIGIKSVRIIVSIYY